GESGGDRGGCLPRGEQLDGRGGGERAEEGGKYNHGCGHPPRHNVMVSSEWAALKTNRPGFKLEDVKAGKYGQQIHFWDWDKKKITKSLDLGEKGLIPLEVRFHHDPASVHGFVGAALSSVMG